MNRANLAAGPSSTSDDEEWDAEFCNKIQHEILWDDFKYAEEKNKIMFAKKLNNNIGRNNGEFNYLILIGETVKEIEVFEREMSTKRHVPISIMFMNGHLGQLEIAVNRARSARHKVLNKLFNATN